MFTVKDGLCNQRVSVSDECYAGTARDEPWPLCKHNNGARHRLKCPRAALVVGMLPLLGIIGSKETTQTAKLTSLICEYDNSHNFENLIIPNCFPWLSSCHSLSPMTSRLLIRFLRLILACSKIHLGLENKVLVRGWLVQNMMEAVQWAMVYICTGLTRNHKGSSVTMWPLPRGSLHL